MNFIFLPATVPGDETYGVTPERIEGFSADSVHAIRFPDQVWYNAVVCRDAIAQIDALGRDPATLIGFSKSGLGAWNIARAIPERVACTIIFDAPVARDILPPWDTQAFYADDAAWQQDLPLRTLDAFKAAMPEKHLLILISGANFHDEMHTLSEALGKHGVRHVFLPRPDLKHHWQSGWIEAGLDVMRRQGFLP